MTSIVRKKRMNGVVDKLLDLLTTQGIRQYGDEQVSQCEHALQCAFLAEREGAPVTLLSAALLHDIGHLRYDAGDRPALRGVDDQHEELGARLLLDAFGPAVAEPVRLHVAAKRYLCATDVNYFGRLSAASQRSLALQGGPFTAAEVAAFDATPYAGQAIRIRLWDEAAKLPGCETPPVEHFRVTLISAVRDYAASAVAGAGLDNGSL
jgi:[1-hydroxy-2-(trimethylamino)ethyl]phosphonate dioxygenase